MLTRVDSPATCFLCGGVRKICLLLDLGPLAYRALG